MGVTQFCGECSGEVNVPQHNGATLRCGCGKTTQAAPPLSRRCHWGSCVAVAKESFKDRFAPSGEFWMCAEHADILKVAGSSTAEHTAVNRAVDGSSPSRPAIHDIDELMAAMIKRKALRVKTQQIEIELSPEAFAQPWAAQTSSLGVDDKPCPCGHSVPVQHNVNGECLEGCDSEACTEKAAA